MTKAKILYVDDTASYRALAKITLSIILEQDVDFAVNGIDALAKMKLKEYDLIITDYHMRRMSCDRMIDEMDRSGSKVPVAILGTEINGYRSDRVTDKIDKRGVVNMDMMYRSVINKALPHIELREAL